MASATMLFLTQLSTCNHAFLSDDLVDLDEEETQKNQHEEDCIVGMHMLGLYFNDRYQNVM